MTQTLGYACINTALKQKGIYTNRTIRAASLKKFGIQMASKLALENSKDLHSIIKWNNEHGIKLFRISSDLFPWGNKINISTLPDYAEIRAVLASAGKLAREYNQRLTSHPGPFNLLASPKEKVVLDTIADLELHSEMFDLLGLEASYYNKINIHIGATYGDKQTAVATWIKNYKRLSENCRARLTIENDDKASMFSVQDLYDMVHKELGIPIVVDEHHHNFNTGGLTINEAIELGIKTWPKNIKPIIHYSESKALHENNAKIRAQAHSDYVHNLPVAINYDVDIMIEAKAKEQAVIFLKTKYKL